MTETRTVGTFDWTRIRQPDRVPNPVALVVISRLSYGDNFRLIGKTMTILGRDDELLMGNLPG